MDMLSKLVAAVFAAFMCWMLFKYIRSNPEALSKANLNKSFYTMGILGLALIAFVALVVVLLRQG